MYLYRVMIVMALVGALAGCDNPPQRPQGEAGPAGAKGDAGPRGPAGPAGTSSITRIIRSNCDATACGAQCNEDEVLLVAYCGAARNAATFPTERSASCRVRNAASSPLVTACVKSGPQ
jgi:hypothetical protein